MPREARPAFPGAQRRLRELGARLRLARLRRRISQADMALRANISRSTLVRLESGEAAVSLGVLTRVLTILSLDADVDKIAAHDELGQRLQDIRQPQPRKRKEDQRG